MEIMIIIMGLLFNASIQRLILGAPVSYAGSIEGLTLRKLIFGVVNVCFLLIFGFRLLICYV